MKSKPYLVKMEQLKTERIFTSGKILWKNLHTHKRIAETTNGETYKHPYDAYRYSDEVREIFNGAAKYHNTTVDFLASMCRKDFISYIDNKSSVRNSDLMQEIRKEKINAGIAWCIENGYGGKAFAKPTDAEIQETISDAARFTTAKLRNFAIPTSISTRNYVAGFTNEGIAEAYKSYCDNEIIQPFRLYARRFFINWIQKAIYEYRGCGTITSGSGQYIAQQSKHDDTVKVSVTKHESSYTDGDGELNTEIFDNIVYGAYNNAAHLDSFAYEEITYHILNCMIYPEWVAVRMLCGMDTKHSGHKFTHADISEKLNTIYNDNRFSPRSAKRFGENAAYKLNNDVIKSALGSGNDMSQLFATITEKLYTKWQKKAILNRM